MLCPKKDEIRPFDMDCINVPAFGNPVFALKVEFTIQHHSAYLQHKCVYIIETMSSSKQISEKIQLVDYGHYPESKFYYSPLIWQHWDVTDLIRNEVAQ